MAPGRTALVLAGTLRHMKTLLVIALVAIVVVIGLKAAGMRVPILDFPLGPVGVPLTQPDIQVQPPGYDIQLP